MSSDVVDSQLQSQSRNVIQLDHDHQQQDVDQDKKSTKKRSRKENDNDSTRLKSSPDNVTRRHIEQFSEKYSTLGTYHKLQYHIVPV